MVLLSTFPSTMALCQLKLCGRVKAHLIAINKFAWPVTHSWVLISSTELAAASHLLQLRVWACHFRGNHGSEDTGSEAYLLQTKKTFFRLCVQVHQKPTGSSTYKDDIQAASLRTNAYSSMWTTCPGPPILKVCSVTKYSE